MWNTVNAQPSRKERMTRYLEIRFKIRKNKLHFLLFWNFDFKRCCQVLEIYHVQSMGKITFGVFAIVSVSFRKFYENVIAQSYFGPWQCVVCCRFQIYSLSFTIATRFLKILNFKNKRNGRQFSKNSICFLLVNNWDFINN